MTQAGAQTIAPSKSPKAIDVTLTEGPMKGVVLLGIYEIDGDTLRVCFDMGGKKRPNSIIDDRGQILPEVLAARRRGVWFDVGK